MFFPSVKANRCLKLPITNIMSKKPKIIRYNK